jgi:hypothetical protein
MNTALRIYSARTLILPPPPEILNAPFTRRHKEGKEGLLF